MQLNLHSSTASHPADRIPVAGNLEFLRKLSHDEAFRRELAARPAEVLAEHGIALDMAQVPERIRLPEKSTLQERLRRAGKDIFPPVWWNHLLSKSGS